MTTTEFLTKLEKMNACKAAREWVATQPDAQTAWDSCTNIGWMEWYFEKTATLEMWEEYEKVQRPTWEEYEKVQRPALEEYEKVVRAAKEEYEKVQRPTWEEYEKVVRTAYEEYQKVEQPAWEEYQKACIAAIRKLMPSP